MQDTESNEVHQGSDGGGTQTVHAGTGGNYGPAGAHAASLAPPVLLFFVGGWWLYGAPVSFFLGSIVLALACWGATLYARRMALKKLPPDSYSAFQYKQAVVFAVSTVIITTLLGATAILAIFTIVVWPLAIGYTFYGAYQVARGRDFRYAVIGRRLSG